MSSADAHRAADGPTCKVHTVDRRSNAVPGAAAPEARNSSRPARRSAGAEPLSRPHSTHRAFAAFVVLIAVSMTLPASSGTITASAEARLVSALSLFESRHGAEAIGELREVVTSYPDWTTARLALASALLRRGVFEEAESLYVGVLGGGTVGEIESGTGTPVDLPPGVLDAVLGLAICRDELGAVRSADRLYRAYADRMGVASPAAARAYYRLAEMLERSGVPWGDPSAERARALALDPDVESSDTLPPLPDAATDSLTEPYTRTVEIVGPELDPGDLLPVSTDSLALDLVAPVLLRYVEPRPVAAVGDSVARGVEMLAVELLVGTDGSVDDVLFGECDGVDCRTLVAVTFAASQWGFAAATLGGEPVPARIRFPVPLGRFTARPGGEGEQP